jgi:hypothetical protein
MNLGKLLFAGKSVVSGSETISYHENKQVFLPKFTSPKNPLAPVKAPAGTAPAPAKKETAPNPWSRERRRRFPTCQNRWRRGRPG